MHFDQNIILIIVAAVIGISRLVARIAENSRNQSQRRNPPPSQPVQERRTTPPVNAAPKTDEQRMREFLEALGVPAGTAPPPKVQPRVDLPPRPIAPVAPPPMSRPFSPVLLKPVAEAARRIFTPKGTPTPSETVARPDTGRPGEWLREERQGQEKATKFEDATRTSEVAPQTTGSSSWRDALRSRDSIRAALVLREILGPPMALREPG